MHSFIHSRYPSPIFFFFPFLLSFVLPFHSLLTQSLSIFSQSLLPPFSQPCPSSTIFSHHILSPYSLTIFSHNILSLSCVSVWVSAGHCTVTLEERLTTVSKKEMYLASSRDRAEINILLKVRKDSSYL